MAAKKRARGKRKRAPKRRVGGRWVPVVFFLVVLLATGFLVVAELRNYFAHPALDVFEHPDGRGRMVLYHRTERARAAQVFLEREDGELVRVAPVFYTGKDWGGEARDKLGELRWTRDGSGILASGEQGQLLWVWDGEVEGVFVGRFGRQRLEAKGGAGPLAVRWFELGATEDVPRLWSWEATRYERLLR